MAQILREVKFQGGKLVGLLNDGSRIQLKSACPSFSVMCGPDAGSRSQIAKNLPKYSYVHFGEEDGIHVVEGTRHFAETLIPYTVYKGRKI